MWERSRARRRHRRALRLWRAGRLRSGQTCETHAVALLERRQRRAPSTDPGELVAALLTLAGQHGELAAHAAAEALLHQAGDWLVTGPPRPAGDPVLAEVLIRLGNTQRLLGQYARAESTLHAALDTGQAPGVDRALLGAAHNAMGIVCRDTARYEQAEDHYRTALTLALDGDLAAQADAHHNLAGLAHAQGRFAEAEASARRALALREQSDGPHSTGTAADTTVLGAALAGLGRHDEAEALLQRASGLWSRRYGPHHYEIAVTLHNLGLIHQHRAEPDRALYCLQEALHIKRAILGPDHVEIATLLNNLAVLHSTHGRVRAAFACYATAIPILEATLGALHPTTRQCRANQHRLFPSSPARHSQ